MIRVCVALLSGAVFIACSTDDPEPGDAGDAAVDGALDAGADADAGPARITALGFTPFPYDVTSAAVDDVYRYLADDADLYAFHTTEGVPWVEAGRDATSDEYGASVRDKWARHRAAFEAHPDHRVYLGLTPLDDSRSRIADYWGGADHLPVPEPYASASFDSPEVRAAYLSHCRRAIEHYDPDYLAIGLEVNLLQNQDPGSWPALVSLLTATYGVLKAEHPDLPIFATVTAVDILPGWTSADDDAQRAALADVLSFSDYLALSFYPFMSVHLTNAVPEGTFDALAALSGGKPMVIAETGYPAQTTSLPSFGLTFEGTPEKQEDWLSVVLDEAAGRRMPFVVNFVARDYDALWVAAGSTDGVAIWRDTGLYDEDGGDRPALTRWRRALALPRL